MPGALARLGSISTPKYINLAWFSSLSLGGLGSLSLAGALICLYKAYIQGPPQMYLPLDLEWQKAWQAQVSQADSPEGEVVVEVVGAVEKPGVYALSIQSRLQDAILTAGGFSPQANQRYIHQELSLAAELKDQQKIYIPFQGETQSQPEEMGSVTPTSVTFNTLTQEMLQKVSGIGEVRSQKVLDAMPFSDEADFRERSGLPKALSDSVIDLYKL